MHFLRFSILLCLWHSHKLNRFIIICFYNFFYFVYCHIKKFSSSIYHIYFFICKCMMKRRL